MTPPPPKEKLTVTWDDVQAPEVDARLKQQQAAARSDALISPALKMSASQLQSAQTRRGSIWYNTAFAMAAFGLLGGLLAWGALELVQMKSISRTQYLALRDEAEKLLPALDHFVPDDEPVAIPIQGLDSVASLRCKQK